MAQYGKSFVYNGVSSEIYDIAIGGLRVEQIPLNLKRTSFAGQMNRYRHSLSMYGINYDSVLTFTIQMIKDPCKYESNKEMRFSRDEIRQITSWLTSPITPRLFHMTDYPETENTETGNQEEEYDYFGVFTNVEASNNGIYCLECTFECNTPYALSAEQSVTITGGSGIVSNPSDEYEDYVYPTVIITPTGNTGSNITLTNVTDGNRSITLKNLTRNDTITMDCKKMTIKNRTGNLISFDDMDIDAIDYIYWFRLLHGDNQVSVTGDATVEFIFRYPVKVGAY